ncbi:hypothetical protein BpHYR1_027418 [Brachionus plicatilis]|uniref:Uncharacterized protein n=1 Tax=Brachionus plicatilis TaxID=10195 RepID=A0A3M7SSD8_BRAPC|nr:hypothetical protein BpHYR1_027418 [Brachionus plicatilis]
MSACILLIFGCHSNSQGSIDKGKKIVFSIVNKHFFSNLSRSNSLSWFWLSSLSEAILESSVNVLQVSSATSTSGVSSFGFFTPVILAESGTGEAARRASLLLNVIRASSATTAQSVRLVVTFTKTLRTLGHFLSKT